MALSDADKATAERLKLTYTEMSVVVATRIDPETYARHKQEIAADRAAWEAKLAELGEYAAADLRRRRGG